MTSTTPKRQTAAGSPVSEMFTPELVNVLREGYGLEAFKADAIAGLTVAIVALPLSMALAIACGLSPDRGLYAAIIGGFIISAFGGTRFQIGGPAGAFIVLIALIVERHGYNGLVLATMMAGVMMIMIGLLRFGTYIKYISYPVTIGFTSGIAVIIFTSQLKELLGLDIEREPAAFLPKLSAIWSGLGSFKPASLAMAALALALILILRKFRPKWPGFLIAITITAILAAFLKLDISTIGSRFGEIPHGLPAPALPDFSFNAMRAVFPDAVAIAFLGSIESLLSAVVADGMTGRRHRSNCELLAQGGANIASMLFGGIPVTGTIARTATNIRSGAKTPVAGMMHAAYLLLFMMLAAPLTIYIPLAALAAVLAVVSWNMAEKTEFTALVKSSYGDALVLLSTFLLTIFADLMIAIAVGVTLGAFLFLHRMAETIEIKSGEQLAAHCTSDGTNNEPNPYAAFADQGTEVVIYKLNGAFFFGATSAVISTLENMGQTPKAFVFDFTNVPFIDSTGAKGLESFAHKLYQNGTKLIVAGARQSVRQNLMNTGFDVPHIQYADSVEAARNMLEP